MSQISDLSLSALANMFNTAVAAGLLPGIAQVQKFGDKGKAVKRIQLLMDTNSLDYVAGQGLVKRAQEPLDDDFVKGIDEELAERARLSQAAARPGPTEEFKEMTQEEIDAQKRPEKEPETPVVSGPTVTPQESPAPTIREHVTQVLTKARKARIATVDRQPKPATEIAACRAGTNQALVLDKLAQGATLEEITAHVNSTLGKSLKQEVIHATMIYDLCTVKGYGIRAEPSEKGTIYHLRLPEGMTAPVPHLAKKS